MNLLPKTLSRAQLILALLVLVLGIISVSQFIMLRQLSSQSEPAGEVELQQILKKVGALVVLPSDETPRLATITDADRLRGQAFFANAKNGNKVLIYPKAGKAILYDPSLNRVVDIAPLTVGAPTTQENP